MYNFYSHNLYLFKIKPIYTLCLLSLSIINAACNLAITVLGLKLLAIAFGNEQFFSESKLPLLGSNLLDSFEAGNRIIIYIVCLFVIVLLRNISSYFVTLVGFGQIRTLIYRLKTQRINTLSKANLDYYYRHQTEDILLQLNSNIEQITLAVTSIQNIFVAAINITILTITLLIISWQLTLFSIITLSSIIIINNLVLAQANKARIVLATANQSLNHQIAEFIRGIRLIKAVANEEQVSKLIAKSFQEKEKVQFVAQLFSATAKLLNEIGIAVLFLILNIAGYYLSGGKIYTVAPLLLAYLSILFWLLPLLNQFKIAKIQYINSRSCLEAKCSFFPLENELIAERGNLILTELTQGITFKTVTFAIGDRQQLIFDKIDLKILPRQTTALIGLQPNSNSAVIDLLRGFYAPVEGTILLDDQELAAYSNDLGKAIAVVSHDTFLFDNSLAYNIAYGVDDASEADIITAAKKAKIYQFIEQLPAGLATEVGKSNLPLSSLQKLQIGIARAFLRNPAIIILDEPWRDLERNPIAVEFVRKTIQLLCRDRTTIILTQQIDLAKTADSIVVFRQGKIVETGTHHQLLQQGNIYLRWHSMQFKTNQQSRQLKLAQKIARKLAQKNNASLTKEIRTNLNTLLTSIDILNQGWFNNDRQEGIILDESFQSAKNILASLKQYERILDQKNDENNY